MFSSTHGPPKDNRRGHYGNANNAPSSTSSTGGAKKGAHTVTDVDVDAGRSSTAYEVCAAAAAAARAVKAVRHVEGAASAAERMYAERARGIVRLRAAMTLRERNDQSTGNDTGGADVSPAVERDKGAGEGAGAGSSRDEGLSTRMADGGKDYGRGAEDGGGLVGCGGCAVLFEANERLLEEARACGFVNE